MRSHKTKASVPLNQTYWNHILLQPKILFIVLLGIVFSAFVFFRFYQLEARMQFTWDQIENAWVMKTWIIDGKVPTQGMEAKGSSGVFLGSGYYYLLYPFYQIFRLHPIAGGYFAGVMSMITFWVVFFGVKQLFTKWIALSCVVIYTFAYHAISFDRIAWPVNVLPLVSIIVFLSLWNILERKYWYYLPLGIAIGVGFHLHLTAIYFVLICIMMIPFLKPWKSIRFTILGLALCVLLFVPILVREFTVQTGNISTGGNYLSEQYQRIYGRRVLQLFPETFIELSGILKLPLGNSLYPLFVGIATYVIGKKRGWRFACLLVCWLFIPTVVLSTFKGEISQYYFVTNRLVFIMVLGYLLHLVVRVKPLIGWGIVFIFFSIFIYRNVSVFLTQPPHPVFQQLLVQAQEDVKQRKPYHFGEGDPYSYIHEWTVYKTYGVWPKGNSWLE